MSENKNKLKVTMQVIVGLSAAGVATVMHHAPASAETYTTATGGYAPTDYIAPLPTGAAAGTAQDKSIGAEARAQVIKQITAASSTVLNFGKIVPSSVSGTIAISSAGAITSAGGSRYIPNSGADNAILTFTGEPGQTIQIDKPVGANLTNGANSMALTFSYGTIPTSIPTVGNVAVEYGGSLAVGANQAPGIYTGTYDFFVTYV